MVERLSPRENPHVAAPLPIFREAVFAGGADDLHELRVRIPVDLHRQLLSLKVLRGRSLAETVSMALDIYFSERSGGLHPEDEEGAPDAPGSPEQTQP